MAVRHFSGDENPAPKSIEASGVGSSSSAGAQDAKCTGALTPQEASEARAARTSRQGGEACQGHEELDPSEDLERSHVEDPSFDDLPPLPEPNRHQMCTESLCGCFFVVVIVCIFVAVVHSSLDGCEDVSVSDSACRAIYGLIGCEAAIAFACLLGLMFGNPGIIKRTPETAFPMPPQVAEYMLAGGCMESLANIRTEDGRSYCVRCLVWRPKPETYAARGASGLLQRTGLVNCKRAAAHHCSTCGRCVMHFDHHCGVFGRCIAGHGCGGNMGFFKGLIMMSQVAGATVVAAFAVSIANRSRAS